MMTVKEASRLTGISIRTLQYYDKLGLLPAMRTESGYRLYDDAALERLQQILLFQLMRLWTLRRHLRNLRKRMNSFRCMPEEWRLRPHLQKKNLIRKRNNSWQQWLKKEDSYLRERIEDTAILQVLLREILMLFREYIKNLLMKSKKLLLKEGQRRVINVGKDIVI